MAYIDDRLHSVRKDDRGNPSGRLVEDEDEVVLGKERVRRVARVGLVELLASGSGMSQRWRSGMIMMMIVDLPPRIGPRC